MSGTMVLTVRGDVQGRCLLIRPNERLLQDGATPDKFEDEWKQAVYEHAGLINEVLNDCEELGI